MMKTISDYEGVYESTDGVTFEARYQGETGLFILSRCDKPSEMRAAEDTAFIETVEDGRVSPVR